MLENICKFEIINLLDESFKGFYNSSQKHQPDLPDVLERSKFHGLEKIIITGGSLEDARNAIEMSKTDGK
jgi:TatD DNase family protein